MPVLYLALAACPRQAPTWTGTAPDTGASTVDTEVTTPPDTGTPTDPTPPADEWTTGPALPDCTPTAGDVDRIALSGVVLTPTGAEAGLVVVNRGTGTIECAGASCAADGATVVCTEGVISPALIDTHDHTQYNVLAPWRHGELFTDRYDWQSDGDYFDYREAYDGMSDAYECEIVKWAELRQIVGGATSVVGSTGDVCIEVLARDLDEDPTAHDIPGYALEFSSSKVFFYDEADAADRAEDLSTGAVEAFLDHVAEGVNGSVRSEVDDMLGLGMAGPGHVYVHATDASVDQLAEMAITGTGIVWSPRSNLDLYADTTPADVAFTVGVPVALGPDWTWSGSNRVPAELSCAREWLSARRARIDDVDLWEMVTLDAAVTLGLQGQLGMLVPGAKADVSVFRWSDQPYRSVIESEYEDVWLVLIDGYARYGDPDLVSGLERDPAWCEAVTACSAPRTLCVQEAASGTDAVGYAELESTLSSALAQTQMPSGLEYAGELYPLWACDEVRATCDPRQVTAGDQDGDGEPDATDDCPTAYDPLQLDHDRDGAGDACDPCPLTGEPSCDHDPADIDDDGEPNGSDGCPTVADPGNPDGDTDGHPDACDPCPTVSNPGVEGCPASIRMLRDPSDPGHPEVGSDVTVSGVITAVGATGAFVQDPDETEFAALFAFGLTGAVGDQVDVTGTYAEYYGLTELEVTSASTTGTGTVQPLQVDPCDVATSGPDAERYESMLIEVGPVSVTDAQPDTSDFNEFVVDGCLRVDDFLCPTCWLDQPAVGTSYSALTGPLYYSFANTKLVPRTAADLAP
ncbi:MAG: hypothetical protein ABMA64_05800 [Myxococcota bacterium]